VQRAQPTRILTESCKVNKPFLFNDYFICVSGHEFFVDGELLFTSEETPDPIYGHGHWDARTRVCTSFLHSGIIYHADNNTLRLAFRRQSCCRALDVDPTGAFDKQLLANQKHIYDIDFKIDFKYDGIDWRELTHKHVSDPHPKKKLREQALRDVTGEMIYYNSIWKSKDGYRIKLKRNEWAKPGKYGRTIGDLGVAASLQGAFFISHCKDYLCSQYFEHLGRYVKYIKSVSHSNLMEVFGNINDDTSLKCMYCHSDDAIYRTRRGLVYNLDISSCDASHRDVIFNILIKYFPGCDNAMTTLVKQLCQVMTIYSSDKKQKCKIRSKGPCLYSGSTLTTLVNTVTMMAIFHQLELYEVETPDEIKNAAYSIGYILGEPQLCDSTTDQQFLKHSPITKNNIPLLNMGVVFRCLGVVKKDLPGGVRNMKKNALDFQGLLINGLLTYVDCPFVNRLKEKWPVPKKPSRGIIAFANEHLPYDYVSTIVRCTDMELFSRYQATPAEIRLLIDRIEKSQDADVIVDPLVNRIIEADYGLGLSL